MNPAACYVVSDGLTEISFMVLKERFTLCSTHIAADYGNQSGWEFIEHRVHPTNDFPIEQYFISEVHEVEEANPYNSFYVRPLPAQICNF